MSAQFCTTGPSMGSYRPYEASIVEKTFLMSAAALAGEVVVNSAGEMLGKIDSVMLDMNSGRVAYAVLSVGGFFGIGDKLFAIPWDALAMDLERDHFVLNADRDLFKNSPGFDKSHWPAVPDSHVLAGLQRYSAAVSAT